MKNNTLLVGVLLAIVAVVPMVYLAYNSLLGSPAQAVVKQQQEQSPRQAEAIIEYLVPNKVMEPGSEFAIKTCRVLDGYNYTLQIENGSWIEVALPVIAKPEAAAVVVEVMKAQTSPPSVLLLGKLGSTWIVDINIVAGQKRTRLRDLLKEKELLL
jgi:hypothetical protein